MSNTPSSLPWDNLYQKFWDSWRQFSGLADAPDFSALWTAVLESQWQTLLTSLNLSTELWKTEALLKLFEQSPVLLRLPPDWQSRLQTNQQLWQGYQQAQQDYLTLLSQMGTRALALLQARLDRWPESQTDFEPRALYDAWIEAGEEAYAELINTEDYARCQAHVLNSLLAWKQQGRSVLDEWLASLDLPTYSEASRLQARLQELRRENKQLQKSQEQQTLVEELTQEITQLRKQLEAVQQPPVSVQVVEQASTEQAVAVETAPPAAEAEEDSAVMVTAPAAAVVVATATPPATPVVAATVGKRNPAPRKTQKKPTTNTLPSRS